MEDHWLYRDSKRTFWTEMRTRFKTYFSHLLSDEDIVIENGEFDERMVLYTYEGYNLRILCRHESAQKYARLNSKQYEGIIKERAIDLAKLIERAKRIWNGGRNDKRLSILYNRF